MEKRFGISDAARQVGVEAHVLRYWEDELGLAIPRNGQGHRYYREQDIHILHKIRDWKEQGFQLRAIKLLLPDRRRVEAMTPQELYHLREELNQKVQMEEGELQLNKDSLSGIPVFQLSHRAVQALAAKKKTTISVDFLPQLGEEELLHMLTELQKQYGKQPVEEVLALFLHKKICGALLHRLSLPFQQEMQTVSDKQLKKLAKLCRHFVFEMSGYPGFDKAQVTMGGVPVSEIDDTMQSGKVRNLYFAGEIIDVDGRCGGYNLQWAWTSGYIAGLHCCDQENVSENRETERENR